jgi:hypothetical protein
MFGKGVRITISTDIIRHAKTWAQSQIHLGQPGVRAVYCAVDRSTTTLNVVLLFATTPAWTSVIITAAFVLSGVSNTGAPKNLLLNKIKEIIVLCNENQ